MIEAKREQKRDDLHHAIWSIANEFRGTVDGWDFKNYVLSTMFYRYISENLTNYINARKKATGNIDFDYAKMSDSETEETRESLVEEKGFFILPSELFCNVNLRADNDENLNKTLERVFLNIESSAKGASSESRFAELFDDFDANSDKLGTTVSMRNEHLAKLLHNIADMDFGVVKDYTMDEFGDVCEYLMNMYASSAKSSVIIAALNETFTYLYPQFDEDRLSDIKKILLSLSGLSEFDFHANKDKRYSYESIQELLSTINEKQSLRKKKGVYYTPSDVVRFILGNSIKSMYGKLGTNGLHVMDFNGIPYKSFCETKKVFDPTCGAGEFLLAALETKFDLLDNHTDNVTNGMIIRTVRTICGNDINADSTTITKLRLFLCTLNRYGLERCLSVESALNSNFTNLDFVSSGPRIEQQFDLIIGNPPFVEDSKSELKLDKKYGNIYANVLINATALLNENGSLGFVLPLSYISTPRMSKLRDDLFSCISEQYILSFSDRPDCLFTSVHQKLCILIGRKERRDKHVFTGNYQYWYKEERATLFNNTIAVKNPFFEEDFIPKLGNTTDLSVYKKIARQHTYHSLSTFATTGSYKVFVNMRATFWIKAFLHEHNGAEYKSFLFDDKGKADYFHCLINSSLFWWYWICVSDCWHITNKELQRFFLPELTDYSKASELAAALENALENTKVYVGTKQVDYEYKHKSCVEEIHAIDDYINNLYGLTPAENIYIKNFAYRYRVSGGTE